MTGETLLHRIKRLFMTPAEKQAEAERELFPKRVAERIARRKAAVDRALRTEQSADAGGERGGGSL